MNFIQRTKINYLLVISITIFLSWVFFSNDKNKFVSAAEDSIESVVTIYSYKNNKSYVNNNIGSGVIFSKDGYIVTNFHIISGNKFIKEISVDSFPNNSKNTPKELKPFEYAIVYINSPL